MRIDRLSAGGDGVGRLEDGRVVFVALSAPGDLVRVRILERKRRYWKAVVEEVLEPGPGRVEPPCPVYARCGGCSWQHLDYPTQLRWKRELLGEALGRIGGIEGVSPDVVPCPAPYGYRQRARILVEGGRLGFRERRSHALCPISDCAVLAPALRDRLRELATSPEVRASESVTPFEIELVASAGGGARVQRLAADGAALGDSQPAELEVLGERLQISAGVFAQSNAPLFESLAAAVCAAADGVGGNLLELYAGAGFLTLPLARRFERVRAVESHPSAARDLGANLRRAGIANVEVVVGRSEAALRGGFRPDVVVVDPPRSGLARGLPQAVAAAGAERIVYVSCDPATLARDLAELLEAGYELGRVEAFDLFPQTAHVETVAQLHLR